MLIQNIKDIQSNLSKNNIQNSLLFSCSVMSNSMQSHGVQHTRLPCPSPSPGICSNSCLLSQWCHPTISYSAVPFSSCLQYFPASGSFLMSQLFTSGGQRIVASVSASVLPVNIHGWFPLELTCLISLMSEGLSSLLQHQSLKAYFFGTQSFYCPALTFIHD